MLVWRESPNILQHVSTVKHGQLCVWNIGDRLSVYKSESVGKVTYQPHNELSEWTCGVSSLFFDIFYLADPSTFPSNECQSEIRRTKRSRSPHTLRILLLDISSDWQLPSSTRCSLWIHFRLCECSFHCKKYLRSNSAAGYMITIKIELLSLVIN